MAKKQTVLPSTSTKLGTFGGVFTPSILTILGVIMYLRFGWVVGNVGLIGTLLIVTLSVGITFLTSLSIAAIATDQKVRIGGAYYMVSRSLGIEPGGAIGIPLYFAQALSVALYTVGFAESMVGAFPVLDQRWVGIATTLGVAGLALISAKAAIKAQYVIMAAIGISLVSLLAGSPLEQSHIEMWGAPGPESESFWVVFAVFFPAVTGIMAGVNMSGDLKNPSKAIPYGTFAAIGVGYLIYMGLPLILASRVDAVTLTKDPLIMRKISYWGDAILLGVWGATLSSAVGSILGAPRVLQALARDGILPRSLSFLGRGAEEDDNPRIGTLLTLGVALTAVWFGNLNLIAPVLTMFFLTTYGVLNVAAGVEGFLGSPSFRPAFQVHWFWSLLGAVGCVAVMFLINVQATIIAIVVVAAIFLWLERRELQSAWGDLRRGIWMTITREGLLHLGSDTEPKSWRPNPLVFSGSPTRRWHLIDFANALTHNRGLLSVASILTEDSVTNKRTASLENSIREYLTDRGVQGLVKITSAESFHQGARQLVEAYGLGPLVPDTIILGSSEREESQAEYCELIRDVYELGRNVLVLQTDAPDEEAFGGRDEIHVWWGGLKGNGGLLLILAYLLQSSVSWRNAEVHLKMVIEDETAAEDVEENLQQITEAIRIDARVDVLVSRNRSFRGILRESSREADLILLGMAAPGDDFLPYYRSMIRRVQDLPTTIHVLAGQEISFGEVLIQRDRMS